MDAIEAERGRSFMAFTRFMADDPTGDDILRALVLGALSGYSVRAATLNMVDRADHRLVQVGSYGVDAPVRSMFEVMPLDSSYPDGTVVADGTALRMSLTDVAERFPLVSRFVEYLKYASTGSVCVVPVVSRAVVIGTLFLMSDTMLPESWEFHEYVITLAQSIAQWFRVRQSEATQHGDAHANTFPFRVSDRERDVADLVGAGLTNGAIARRLGFSEATIRADLARLGKVLGVSGRRSIHARMIDLGLLDG